jgi:hypothetical protein
MIDRIFFVALASDDVDDNEVKEREKKHNSKPKRLRYNFRPHYE